MSGEAKTHSQRERPSNHGKILGHALALIAMAGRRDAPFELPDMCATCAFREGCMTNQMAATGKVALDCVLGIDKDLFACHHGMKDGSPSKICVGYVAARLAPWSIMVEILNTLKADLDERPDTDEVRAAFDAWLDEVDPQRKMNDYELARAYTKRSPSPGFRDAGGGRWRDRVRNHEEELK